MKRSIAELITRDPEKFAHHDRVFKNNPVVMQGMGLAPLVVLATTGKNALMLAVAVALLLTPSRMLACLVSRLFPLRDEQPAPEELEKKLLPRALVIMGDGTDSELLAEEGIDHTAAFVALTGLDEANILMAMCASRQTEQCKVVAKINRRSLMDLVSSEGIIDSVVSARDVTTELIVQYVRAMEGAAGSQIKTLHRLVEGAVEALEFHVDRDPDLVNVPLRELKLRSGVLIAGIVRRDGEIVIPGGNDTIRAGDDVIVVTQDTALQELRDILRQG